MEFNPARLRFYRETEKPDTAIDLALAALYIAQEAYPELEPEEYISALDVMAEELKELVAEEHYPLRIVQKINHYLYNELGFQGNEENFYDPRNSMLNEVLDRRKGIPITLALVYLEVARRIDFSMVGIAFPGHFLIQPNHEGMEIYVDAFHKGEILFIEDCQQRINAAYGQEVPIQPAFLEPVSSRQFLARMLTNLKIIYLHSREFEKSLGAVERILWMFPTAPVERRDRGLLCYRLERWQEARADLETYLKSFPNASDAKDIRQLLEDM
jgi:regulator of sirC expression with transglutaminase-like and TPR domain